MNALPHSTPRDGRHFSLTRPKRGRVVAAGMVAIAATFAGPIAPSQRAAANPAFGSTTVFATVPSPGHPFNVLVGPQRVYAVTAAGSALSSLVNTLGERLFTYRFDGTLDSAITIPATPNMGLFGLALDGNQRLYVGDMNNRLLRFHIASGTPAGEEVYANIPLPFVYGAWPAAMWNGISFDPIGNLYMADFAGRIWRITPGGTPQIWFSDIRLASDTVTGAGPFGTAIGPDNRLYFSDENVNLPAHGGDGLIWSLPLVDRPQAADLRLFHTFPCPPIVQCATQLGVWMTGIAFARSGRLYVPLTSLNQIAVLAPDGAEVGRISSPLFKSPLGVAFLGDSLLVTNADDPFPGLGNHPADWKILETYVGESGFALNTPVEPR